MGWNLKSGVAGRKGLIENWPVLKWVLAHIEILLFFIISSVKYQKIRIEWWCGCIRRRRRKWWWLAAYSSSAVCASAWELICRLLTWLLNRSGWENAGKSWEIIWRSDSEIDADAGFQTPIISVRVLSLLRVVGRVSFAFCSILNHSCRNFFVGIVSILNNRLGICFWLNNYWLVYYPIFIIIYFYFSFTMDK